VQAGFIIATGEDRRRGRNTRSGRSEPGYVRFFIIASQVKNPPRLKTIFRSAAAIAEYNVAYFREKK